VAGWACYTGDGAAVASFTGTGNGYATIAVDATRDTCNIWWAVIRRRVSERLDLNLLRDPRFRLRIEARIRVSHAPRRVNLHLNTQRTTDFHTHLTEFDIPDTSDWHLISMTTRGFDARPGDSVYGQLALMDWGLGRYRVDVDSFRVGIVDIPSAGPDHGTQVPYHPPVADPRSMKFHIRVSDDATVDRAHPGTCINNWSSGETILLTVSHAQYVILRWDLSRVAGRSVDGSGLLEIFTHSLQRSPEFDKDFGMVRIVEILGGSPEWNQRDVTHESFTRNASAEPVLNEQMIIDVPVREKRGSTTLATIPRPVLQRMINGTTRGLALLPLGAVVASFYAMENDGGARAARLHFDVRP
jgi:hypothetical protein